MKQVRYAIAWLGAAAISAAVVMSGCTAAPLVGWDECAQDVPTWVAAYCPDGGVESDAGADSADSNPNAIGDPGLDIEQLAPCSTGRCLPTPTGNEAGLWSEIPISLWIGPPNAAPAKCPDDPIAGVPNEKFRLYDKLVAPAATCPTCNCGPSTGTCEGVPETIELRAGKCNQSGVMTTPFDNPPNWDGSCTNADSIAAGAKCPTGSTNLCTQSVHSSALPPPNDSCNASTNGTATVPEATWEIEAVACHANTVVKTCGSETLKKYCVNYPGPTWLQCTYREGIHDSCPQNYQYRREVLYPKLPVDTRACSTCECGTPEGSACLAALSLSSDAACNVAVQLQVGSMDGICYDFLSPGIAIGSKAIVNRTYLPGICAASGGKPTGEASADVAQAVTFCCAEPVEEQGVPE